MKSALTIDSRVLGSLFLEAMEKAENCESPEPMLRVLEVYALHELTAKLGAVERRLGAIERQLSRGNSNE